MIIIQQLITAMLGSLGFALIFHVSKKYLISAAFGGFVCWGVYLLAAEFLSGFFFAPFVAAVVSTLYSEISARCFKAPTTVFLIPSVIPLIPGSSLYYAMHYAVLGDYLQFKSFGTQTALVAFGMAVGISLVSGIFAVVFRMIRVKHAMPDK